MIITCKSITFNHCGRRKARVLSNGTKMCIYERVIYQFEDSYINELKKGLDGALCILCFSFICKFKRYII